MTHESGQGAIPGSGVPTFGGTAMQEGCSVGCVGPVQKCVPALQWGHKTTQKVVSLYGVSRVDVCPQAAPAPITFSCSKFLPKFPSETTLISLKNMPSLCCWGATAMF